MAQSNCQRRYLAFCISELQITEKGVKSMIESIKYINLRGEGTFGRGKLNLFTLVCKKISNYRCCNVFLYNQIII